MEPWRIDYTADLQPLLAELDALMRALVGGPIDGRPRARASTASTATTSTLGTAMRRAWRRARPIDSNLRGALREALLQIQ